MAVFGTLMPDRSICALIAVVAAIASSPASAAEAFAFDIPSGRLDRAIMAFGRQAGVSIALADPVLGRIRVHSVRGRVDAASALRRMLEGTGLGFVAIDGRTFRIVAIPAPLATSGHSPQRPYPRTPPPPEPGTQPLEIVVTASKRDTILASFAGTISVVALDSRFGGASGLRGTGAIVQRLPVLSSTSLGPGRNKLFIRGVADSSFTGPTQATVGQYLGDVRLNFNAPDPDLDLYDIGQVEVLEGPQGTLYGAGSLGGIVRMIPNPPDAGEVQASLRAGVSATANGARGSDLAGMVNVPVVADHVALRLVGYRGIDGGYIDDVRRGLKDVNSSKTTGGRVALRIQPGDGWMIDAGYLLQNINNRDSQYAERNQRDLSRASAIAQPFDNDYMLGQFTIRKSWGRLKLNSATAVVEHNVDTRYDATSAAAGTPVAFDQDIAIRLITNETRLSRSNADGTGWVAGLGLVSNRERLTRSLGNPSAPATIPGVRNELHEAAVYGEWSFGVVPDFYASIGGRVTYTRLVGEAIDPALGDPPEPSRHATRFLPLAALSWKPTPGVIVYARYQEGFRAGGLSVSSTGSGQSVTRFEPDTISTFEIGARYGEADRDRFSAAVTASYARWESIQADLVDTAGFPYSTNIGNGRILGFSASATWRPFDALAIEATAFVNDSGLTQPSPGFARAEGNDLPNIARLGARLGSTYTYELGPDLDLKLNASARYVGRSNLGVGNMLDIPQGKYIDSALDIRLGYKGVGLVLGVTNLANADNNRFSLGNPFSVVNRLQQTPLRPRTFRIGLDAAF